MIVIDTDILIDHFHGNPLATSFIRQAIISGELLAISVVTVSEILAGMRPGEEQNTEALLSLFSIIPVDEPLARTAGTFLNQYGRNHHLDLGDVLIAATTKQLGSILFTRNLRHYPMTDITVKVPYEHGT